MAAPKALDPGAVKAEIDGHLKGAKRSILADMGAVFSEEVKEVL